MRFAHDTEFALLTATALVNTATADHDTLGDPAALDRFLTDHRDSGHRRGNAAELADVIALRSRLQALWDVASMSGAAALVNALLRDTQPQPQLTNHDGTGWHLHATSGEAPLAQRMGAEAAMAFAELVRSDGIDRLRRCDVPDCRAVLVDFSRNRSRRYCDVGNCGNRQHVAAYRARKAILRP